MRTFLIVIVTLLLVFGSLIGGTFLFCYCLLSDHAMMAIPVAVLTLVTAIALPVIFARAMSKPSE
jgi:hypothetical protein